MINETLIQDTLEKAEKADAVHVRQILSKALEMKGLNAGDIAVLSGISDPELLAELFETAKKVKDSIYGRRLVLFAPLYISNLCKNECLYCAFRVRNKEVKRRALSQKEIAREIEILVQQGHKRVLVVAGESYPTEGFKYVLDTIKTVYATRVGKGEVRRVNVNIAPLTLEEFKQLKDTNIGTYQLFQETYHKGTYKNVHLAGKKTDFDWRVTAMDRGLTMWALAYCSGCATGGLNCWR
jgi:2-iminoacetate synthase